MSARAGSGTATRWRENSGCGTGGERPKRGGGATLRTRVGPGRRDVSRRPVAASVGADGTRTRATAEAARAKKVRRARADSSASDAPLISRTRDPHTDVHTHRAYTHTHRHTQTHTRRHTHTQSHTRKRRGGGDPKSKPLPTRRIFPPKTPRFPPERLRNALLRSSNTAPPIPRLFFFDLLSSSE